jgi:DNA modification methylase
MAEADVILEEAAATRDAGEGEDQIPEIESTPVSEALDMWICGPHRLVCGDARDDTSYKKVLGERKAASVITDPPYNVPIKGHVSRLRHKRHHEFPMANGDMNEAAFSKFLETSFQCMASHSGNGSIHYVFMDWRHIDEMMIAGRKIYSELKNICIWNKTKAGMGSLYRSQHEFVFVWLNGSSAHVNNVQLGRYGRSRSNVWDYGFNAVEDDRAGEAGIHPTVKPVALVADAIKDCSRRDDIVLDPFAGSGTILIACERTGRKACAIEFDPLYVDVAVRRWQTYTGKFAIHADTGLTFEQMAEQRSSSRALGAIS